MIDKNFSTKIFKAILRRSLGLSEHKLIHPEREWLTGLFVALLILIGGVSWAVYLYLNVKNVSPETTPTNATTEQIYRSGDIAIALEELESRREKNQNFKENLETGPKLPSFIIVTPTPNEPKPETNSTTSATRISTPETSGGDSATESLIPIQ